MVWSELKGETKVAIGALVLSLLAFVVGEYRNLYSKYTEEFNSIIKLEIITELTTKPYTMKFPEIEANILKLNEDRFWPWEKIAKGEISQAIYELTKDRLVLYVGSSNTYEFVSYDSAHKESIETDDEQYHKSESGIKLNIMSLLNDKKTLRQDQIYDLYELRYKKETKKHSIAKALYSLIKDEIVLFTSDTGGYELKSFNSIH